MEPLEAQRQAAFPLGAAVTLAELDQDPHAALARLRATEPVSWLPSLEGWLVTRHDLVLAAMRDAQAFTVDDPRFSTAQVVGPSMLSLDGVEHDRHRAPFVGPFRAGEVAGRFAQTTEDEANRLVDELAPAGAAELRRAFAGPMAASIVTQALGLGRDEVDDVLAWYDAIVASVTEITAGNGATAAGEEAFGHLSERLRVVIDGGDDSSLLAAAAGAGGAVDRAGHLQRRGAAVRRDRDDRGDDRQRRAVPAGRARARGRPRGPSRRRWTRRSTSRCGWSRRRR